MKNIIANIFNPITTKKAISIIVVLGFIVFGNALFNGFVWDDSIFLNNPERFSTGILNFFTENLARSVGYYRPIYLLYFALLYKVFGSQAFFYHFFQIVLHIINAIILYLLLISLFARINAKTEEKEWNNLSGSQKIKYQRKHGFVGKAPNVLEPKINLLSLFLSLVFLVHPINVESVVYVAAANNELFFLFGILALLVSSKEKINLKDLFLVSGLTLLSLLSKETGFVFPLMIVCFQFLYHRNRFLKFFIFELTSLAIYFFIRFAIGGVYFSKFITILPVPISRLSFLERLVNIPQIVLYYLTTSFFPLRLAIQQQWVVTKITIQDFYLPLLLDSMFFTALFICGVYLYNHKRKYFTVFLFFFVWFISGLLLLVQIFPLDMTVADRFFYFPLIGLLGMLGVGVLTLLFSPNKHDAPLVEHDKAKIVTALFGAIIILLLSVRTIVRNTNFHDDMTLETHDAQTYDNSTMEDYLGRSYFQQKNMHDS